MGPKAKSLQSTFQTGFLELKGNKEASGLNDPTHTLSVIF